jgi:GTP-binding protein YchF
VARVSFNCGIVGLPNTGKSTLFNALTGAGAEVANYPFCTIDPNVGVVAVPDARLQVLAEIVHPQRAIPVTIEFTDIAGLVRGAAQGEGLGNRFLGHIRNVDAIVHVVRCFQTTGVTHVEGTVDPVRDLETINLELTLADLEVLERRREHTQRMLKTGQEKYRKELALIDSLADFLGRGIPVRLAELPGKEALASELALLTAKPVLYVANVSEEDPQAPNLLVEQLTEQATRENAPVVVVNAAIEAELTSLDPVEREEFRNTFGLKETGLDRLVRAGYQLLNLITFFTVKLPEVRAWTVPAGTKAPQAAGKIHTDFERGFIRAEVVSYPHLVTSGSFPAAREKGLAHLEGKDYIVCDGDVILFRFNV